MKITKNILNFLFVLLLMMQLISCGQKEKSPPKKDDMSSMPGMDMSGKSLPQKSANLSLTTISLNDVIRPTNQFVLSSLPLTTIQKQTKKIDLQFYGFINYNEKGAEVISSRISGRIDKLYVKYRFETISKGEKLLELYSPELITAQQELLFLIQNDAKNASIIESAKQKLLLLGMTETQLNELIQKKEVKNTITIYSSYSGHIHDAGNTSSMNSMEPVMNEFSQITQALSLKEGMYIEKGQPLFVIYNPANAWILANVFPEQQPCIHKGDNIQITSDMDSTIRFNGKVDFIEPQYREGSKTLNARIYFNNSALKLPIGSRVEVISKNININGLWLPASSILSLGMDNIIFVKSENGFVARKIDVKFSAKGISNVEGDFSAKDSIVLNAQYLIDSESFIKVKK